MGFSPTGFKELENLEDPDHPRAAGIAVGLGSQHNPKKAISFDTLVALSHLFFFFTLEGTEAEIVTLIFLPSTTSTSVMPKISPGSISAFCMTSFLNNQVSI